MDLSKIQNQQLRELIQGSLKFNSLPDQEQQERINQIIALPVEKEDQLIAFFQRQNQIEQMTPEQKLAEKERLINSFIQDVQDLTAKYKRLMRKDKEVQSESKDEAEMAHLMDELNGK